MSRARTHAHTRTHNRYILIELMHEVYLSVFVYMIYTYILFHDQRSTRECVVIQEVALVAVKQRAGT